MTQRENQLLREVLNNQEELKTDFVSVKSEITDIYRAIYGDEKNKVDGLLARQIKDEKVHRVILDKIDPVVKVHSFVTSGKLWGVLVGLGTIIGILIKFELIKI